MVEQDVAGAAEPDNVKGAVVIGMMSVNALRTFACRARLDINPTVASQKIDDQASIVLASIYRILAVLASIGLNMRPPLLSFRWTCHPFAMTSSVFGALTRCGRIDMHTRFTPISYAERSAIRLGKFRQQFCCETPSTNMRTPFISISRLGLEGSA